MFMTRSPVDELATLRAQICELRARECALERQLSAPGDGRIPGFHHDLMIETHSHRVFDISLLPEDILDDPQFYRSREVTTLRLVDKEGAIDITGDPADFDVIEHG